MFTLKVKIGRGELTFQAPNEKSIFRASAVYGGLPDKCDCCQSDDLYLSFKNPKGNDYYSIKCKSCGAELNLHQKKEGGFYLVDGEKMTKYDPNASGQPPQQTTTDNIQWHNNGQQAPPPPTYNTNTGTDNTPSPY